MAAKPEEPNTTAPPAEGASLSNDGSAEKQPEPVPTSESAANIEADAEKKQIEEAIAGVADVSMDDKTTDEKKPEDATTALPASESAPVATAAPVVAPAATAETTPAAEPTKAAEPATVAETAPAVETAPAADTTPVVAPTPAAEPAPAATVDPATTTGPTWPETAADHPLTRFYDAFEELVKQAEHSEIFGIELSKSDAFHTKLILQKFLRANQNDVDKAKQQLLETLRWRKEFNPVKAAGESVDKAKFDGLGYIIEVEGVPGSDNKKDVVTFNVYGAVKDNKATFGNLDEFLRWRVGLMEKSVQKLNLKDATKPIPNFGEGHDPYQGFQVHDYLQVSFLRQDPLVKTATKKTIEVLGRYYPETLSRKFFVNVPLVMGWLYNAMKLIVAKETVKKMTVLSYGNQLASELGQGIPNEYGGTSASLKEVGEGMNFAA